MDIRNPELLEAVMALPNRFDEYRKVAQDRFEKIESKLDDAVFVNLQNGDGQRMKVANILPKMHTDLKEIKEATEFLRDFAKLHRIFQKYKIYWIVIVTFTGWQIGSPLFEIRYLPSLSFTSRHSSIK